MSAKEEGKEEGKQAGRQEGRKEGRKEERKVGRDLQVEGNRPPHVITGWHSSKRPGGHGFSPLCTTTQYYGYQDRTPGYHRRCRRHATGIALIDKEDTVTRSSDDQLKANQLLTTKTSHF